ncbi:MAG TPA: cobalamin-binding protein [Burkholderiales bacterium]|nr:cobalamin-binding protein [Burkholderiales bacterium]
MVPRLLRCAALLLAALHVPSFAGQWKDDRGVEVSVPATPLRIIALSPHLAEIVYAAGAGSRLAAVVRYSDYPQEAARLPQVGDASRLDIERILALQPDLVLGWKSGNPAHDLQRLERLKLPVFVTEAQRLADIPRLVRTVGAIAGTQSRADAAADTLERELQSLRARYAARAPVRVFYQIWHRPLLTVNGRHLISDVLDLCGGRNVFSGAPVLTPSVSIEAVLAAGPDVVLGGSSAMRAEELAAQWSAAPVSALRRVPVRYVPADLIQRQTPRILEGARIVCEHLEGVRRER